ncbi:class II glutamine amidotransferase [Methylophaga lonarensis]|uniref:class II glutamine amidotransferase n=1 Tax=Methylophaga lonarensis TaxID=999151 RepID=UPI003D2C8265
MGISSQQPFSSELLLAEFFQRGGASDHHSDGWGLAYYDEQDSQLRHGLQPAFSCYQARRIISRHLKATSLLAHIRKATVGDLKLVNAHPFRRSLWGQDWVFAQNGDLLDYQPELRTGFHPTGETDSERAFCYLFDELSEHYPSRMPSQQQLAAILKLLSDDIARHGSFNYLLANHEFMFAYCSTELYWSSLVFDDVILPGESAGRQEAQSLTEATGQRVVLISTQPLSLYQPWYPMGRGELRLFHKGQLTATLFDPEKESHPLIVPPAFSQSVLYL